MGFRVPGSEIPTKQKITGFLAHSTCRHLADQCVWMGRPSCRDGPSYVAPFCHVTILTQSVVMLTHYNYLHIYSKVVAAYNEPIPGWIGNKNGPILLFRAVRAGVLHVTQFDFSKNNLDLIPVDMTANSLLASVWDYVVHRYYIILLERFM